MIKFIQSITDKELKYISERDYGSDAEKHLEALRSVIFKQNGLITEDQCWYPYEVVELGSNALHEGHEREFVICTLLIILNVKNGTDLVNDLDHKFESFSYEYDRLPKELSELVLNGYVGACC